MVVQKCSRCKRVYKMYDENYDSLVTDKEYREFPPRPYRRKQIHLCKDCKEKFEKWMGKGCDWSIKAKDRMERLTQYTGDGENYESINPIDPICEYGKINLQVLENKLGTYEDAEEQGLLLRLPCKVGDIVFCIYEGKTKCSKYNQKFDEYDCQGCDCGVGECDSRREKYVTGQKAYSLDWIVANLKRFGETIFLNRPDAEDKLKEMESSYDD